MAADISKQQLMFSLIEVWKKGDQTQREFCKEKELDHQQYQYWLRRYKQTIEPGSGQSSFTQVKLKTQALTAGALQLVFPDGRKLIFHQPIDASFVRSLIQ